ncbi:MAG: CinA family protein [Rhodospirillales bacterium]|jgi:nicotinamide-nucleotide amidase|nr:CinA family protein [Rhodospirillales bacterium]
MNSAKFLKVMDACKAKGLMLSTAESCTGGMIAAGLTDIAGSSSVFERGFVTYTNKSKHEMLGVAESLLEKYGAVSPHVALAMAGGALENSDAHISVAVTGIAGPGGGSDEKPVGLVHIACAHEGAKSIHKRFEFSGDRSRVRELSVAAALDMILEILD